MQDYTVIIEEAKKEGANILTPSITIEGLTPNHRPVVEKISLSPNPDDGDVYPSDGKLRLSGKAIEKLALCAGVTWNLNETRRTDDGHDREYISYQAVGGIRKPDGSFVYMKGEYDIDLLVLEEEIRGQAEQRLQKAKSNGQKWAKDMNEKQSKEYVEYCTNRDMLQKKKHRRKLAESGARNRVIRALLGLKNAYTREELSRPFVVVRIVFQPDYNDQDVKRAMLAAHIQATTGIFGQVAQIEHQVIDVPGNDDREPADTLIPPSGNDPEQGKNSTMDPDGYLSADYFASIHRDDQITELKNMAKRKGYDLKQLKSPLKDFKDNHLVGFFNALKAMPDIKTAA